MYLDSPKKRRPGISMVDSFLLKSQKVNLFWFVQDAIGFLYYSNAPKSNCILIQAPGGVNENSSGWDEGFPSRRGKTGILCGDIDSKKGLENLHKFTVCIENGLIIW